MNCRYCSQANVSLRHVAECPKRPPTTIPVSAGIRFGEVDVMRQRIARIDAGLPEVEPEIRNAEEIRNAPPKEIRNAKQRGRKPKGQRAQTSAERQKAYRARQRTELVEDI